MQRHVSLLLLLGDTTSAAFQDSPLSFQSQRPRLSNAAFLCISPSSTIIPRKPVRCRRRERCVSLFEERLNTLASQKVGANPSTTNTATMPIAQNDSVLACQNGTTRRRRRRQSPRQLHAAMMAVAPHSNSSEHKSSGRSSTSGRIATWSSRGSIVRQARASRWRAGSAGLHMGRRTELGASPWKTDERTVQEWLQFSDGELSKLNKVLRGKAIGSVDRILEDRLAMLADGKTDSTVGFFRVDFRMSKADTRSLMMRFPRLLVMPRETAVKRCEWLVNNLQLNKKQLSRMVSKCPMIFAYGEDASYAPVVEWLQVYLGMNIKEVARTVVKLPQILGLTPDTNLRKTVRFMESLGLTRSQVSKVVLAHPVIFSYSVENKIIPMLEWLQENLRASPDDVIMIVTKYPSILGCSPAKNLAPKLSFLKEILQASVEDIRNAVVACPSLLGYSLERRIRPRVSLMLECGVDPKFTEHKWLLTAHSEETFEQWMSENAGYRR